jgi:hypothetical protein
MSLSLHPPPYVIRGGDRRLHPMKKTKTSLIKSEMVHTPVSLSNPKITKNGRYWRVTANPDHPLAGFKGLIPLHRLVCWEAHGKPKNSDCVWCGFSLPWKTTIGGYQYAVVNVDHLDSNPSNNLAENLVPSCAWCNSNRQWAEKHPKFWSDWRRWMKDVPPAFRPNLIKIAQEFGLDVTNEVEE